MIYSYELPHPENDLSSSYFFWRFFCSQNLKHSNTHGVICQVEVPHKYRDNCETCARLLWTSWSARSSLGGCNRQDTHPADLSLDLYPQPLNLVIIAFDSNMIKTVSNIQDHPITTPAAPISSKVLTTIHSSAPVVRAIHNISVLAVSMPVSWWAMASSSSCLLPMLYALV